MCSVVVWFAKSFIRTEMRSYKVCLGVTPYRLNSVKTPVAPRARPRSYLTFLDKYLLLTWIWLTVLMGYVGTVLGDMRRVLLKIVRVNVHPTKVQHSIPKSSKPPFIHVRFDAEPHNIT